MLQIESQGIKEGLDPQMLLTLAYLISDESGIYPSGINLNTPLGGLQLNDVDTASLMIEIEDQIGVRIDRNDETRLFHMEMGRDDPKPTVRDLAHLIQDAKKRAIA